MSFTNVYYKRTAGTEKACYVCYKPTTTVLATINTVDFLYTCPSHLEDRGFASKLGGTDGAGSVQKPGLSDEEIAKIKEEWEQKQKAKLEKEKEKAKKEKEKEKTESGGSKDEDSNKGKEIKRDDSKSPKIPGSIPTSNPPTPTHEKYSLHRDYFAMRQGEHRKRKQLAQAKELAPRLPGAPSGIIQDKY